MKIQSELNRNIEPLIEGLEVTILIKQYSNIHWHYVDYQVEEQFSDYKNNALVFGRSNRNQNGEYTNIGKSGGVIKTGAGLKNVKIALLAA